MMWTSPRLLSTTLVGLALFACGERLTSGEEGVEPDMEAPEDDTLGVLDSCLPTLYPPGYEGEFCPAFSSFTSQTMAPGVCAGCFCAQACMTDEDCPLGAQGEAPARCDMRGWCVVDCSEAPCPEGMQCITETQWERPMCHWVITQANQDACEFFGF